MNWLGVVIPRPMGVCGHRACSKTESVANLPGHRGRARGAIPPSLRDSSFSASRLYIRVEPVADDGKAPSPRSPCRRRVNGPSEVHAPTWPVEPCYLPGAPGPPPTPPPPAFAKVSSACLRTTPTCHQQKWGEMCGSSKGDGVVGSPRGAFLHPLEDAADARVLCRVSPLSDDKLLQPQPPPGAVSPRTENMLGGQGACS